VSPSDCCTGSGCQYSSCQMGTADHQELLTFLLLLRQ
jgi:hypothetical protein